MFLLLNEHSIPFNGNAIQSRKILESFIETFTYIVKISNGKIYNSLQTSLDLKTIMLNDKYGFNVWRNQKIDKDLLRKFLSICDRQRIISEAINDEIEVRYGDYFDGALQVAYKNDYALLSFATEKIWRSPEFNVIVNFIDDTESESYILKNFYDKAVDDNNDWIENLPITAFIDKYPNVDVLYRNLEDALPNLIFHNKAKKQLQDEIQTSWYYSLANRLYELNEFCAYIDDGDLCKRKFAPRTISSESPETLKRFEKEYSFTYKDKKFKVKYHLRYTGNNQGRIYFVPVDDKKCIVYSLTTKLPTAKDPKLSVK